MSLVSRLRSAFTALTGPIAPPSPTSQPPRARAFYGLGFGGQLYDGLARSTNRVERPVFATDSRYTLTQWNRTKALGLARWAYVNVNFVRGAVDLMARLTVGTGFTCKSQTSNPGWNKLADAYVAAKFRNIGFTGGESMDELLLHDCRSADIDGDLGYVMTYDETGAEKLQLIEGHRIKSPVDADPTCVDGVWIDGFGRRLAYNVALGDPQKFERIAAQSFIYLAERNRPDELRSMTNLVHALAPIQDLYEIWAFEMTSVKKNSEIGVVVETPTPDDPPLGPPVNVFAREAEAAVGNTPPEESGDQPAQAEQYVTREQIYGGGGKIPVLKPGEKVSTYDHNRPGPGIDAWGRLIIRGMAVGYGVPFEALWDPSTIGGANTRMITSLLRARLEQRRNNLVFPKLRRVRYWLLARAIQRGDLPPNPELAKVSFQPNFIDLTVDAGRESRERRANVQAGLDTFTGYFTENGESYLETALPEREKEIDAQCAAAERLVALHPHLTFEAALARLALVTPNANEANAGAGAQPTPDPTA